jgi:hypothetical protein
MHFRLHSKYMDTEGHRRAAMSILLRHVGAIDETFGLRHISCPIPQGDVLVMEGAGVQEYYE